MWLGHRARVSISPPYDQHRKVALNMKIFNTILNHAYIYLNKEVPKYTKALEESLPALLGRKLSFSEHWILINPQIYIYLNISMRCKRRINEEIPHNIERKRNVDASLLWILYNALSLWSLCYRFSSLFDIFWLFWPLFISFLLLFFSLSAFYTMGRLTPRPSSPKTQN